MGIPSWDDIVLIEHGKNPGDPTVVTVNCPDKAGLGCDLCRVILEFGLYVTRGDFSTDGKWCYIVLWVVPRPSSLTIDWESLKNRLLSVCPSCLISFYFNQQSTASPPPPVYLLKVFCLDRKGLLVRLPATPEMSATAPPPLKFSLSTPNKFPNSSPPFFLASKNSRSLIRCELRSLENSSSSSPSKWTVDCVSGTGTDPIHIILKPPATPLAMTSLESTMKSSKRVCLYYCAEMKDLAERIAAESDAIELRSITWRTFEDGFPNLFISNAHGIRGQHVAFLASFSSPGVIFEQLSVIYALPKLFVSSFTLVLPFFPTGTSERMEEEGDVATAFTLARILSNIPISKGGPTSLVIFDIHALQERFYFGDNILPCFESGIPLLLQRLQQLPDSDNISIAFPDDGAWKRFHKQLQHFPTIICAKVREGDQRIVRLKEGEPKGRHVVIVDDLVQSGGTLIECQKLLAKHGASKISAYVTHGIFPDRSWQRFDHDKGGNPENGMTYFWITDSCPQTVKEVKNRAPFEILSLGAVIAASLQI